MSDDRAPIEDMRFVMDELADLPGIARLPGFEEATPDMADAILEEAAKFTGEVLAPLNAVGDREGCRWQDGAVSTPPGWKEAYRQYCEGGWNGIACSPAFGGQGLPGVLAVAVKEMVCSANLAFSVCPLLTTGLPDANMLSLVEATCSADRVRPLTDNVQALAPTPIDYAINAELVLYKNTDVASVLAQAQAAAEAYKADRAAGLGRDIVPVQVESALKVAGVYDIVRTAPAKIVLAENEWARCTGINLVVTGTVDG